MFYATHNADGGRIFPFAHIVALPNMYEVYKYLLYGYSPEEWAFDTAVIEPGRFGDYWVASTTPPEIRNGLLRFGLFYCAPFSADQLIVHEPGGHPCGQCWIAEPIAEVLILTSIHSSFVEAD